MFDPINDSLDLKQFEMLTDKQFDKGIHPWESNVTDQMM